MTEKTILKFATVAEQETGAFKRIVGFCYASSLFGLIDATPELAANPRSAKVGAVTDAILESLTTDPDTFPLKTKGILAASSDYTPLERRRYEVTFVDDIEGILDGGHNLLAIGLFLLKKAEIPASKIKKIKRWEDFRTAWQEYRTELEAIRKDQTFFIPFELLVPNDTENFGDASQFRTELLDICAARNNNAELTLSTKANQKGFYNFLKERLPETISKRVEWKAGTAGCDLKVTDIIALAWIPLSKIRATNHTPTQTQTYSSRGECLKQFDRLMEEASRNEGGKNYIQHLNDPLIESALERVGDFLELFDELYKDFPEAYNKNGGRFGGISCVKIYDREKKGAGYRRTQPTTKFFKNPVNYEYSEGMIFPLIWGFKELLDVQDGKVDWVIRNPFNFLRQNLNDIVQSYRFVLEMSNFDPQKIGKNQASYSVAQNAFQTAYLKSTALSRKSH